MVTSVLSLVFSQQCQKLDINVFPTHFVHTDSCSYKLKLVRCVRNTVMQVVLKAFKFVVPLDIGITLETSDLEFDSF